MTTPLLFALLVLPLSASAQNPAADSILQEVDATAAALQDATLVQTLEVSAADGTTKNSLDLKTRVKGVNTVLTVTGPADAKGFALFFSGPDTTYAVLPAFGRRVRRLGPDGKSQSFFGTDIMTGDLYAAPYAASWTPALVETTLGQWVLALTSKKQPARKIKIWVDRSTKRVVKTEATGENGGVSTLRVVSAETNTGLPDALFTKTGFAAD